MTNSSVETLPRLPAHPGITCLGAVGPAPESATSVVALMPTSADPRVASENFTAERLAAIVNVTGRLIAPMSRHPDDQEIAIFPGTLALFVSSVAVSGLTNDVVLLAETGTAPGLPADLTELISCRHPAGDRCACEAGRHDPLAWTHLRTAQRPRRERHMSGEDGFA